MLNQCRKTSLERCKRSVRHRPRSSTLKVTAWDPLLRQMSSSLSRDTRQTRHSPINNLPISRDPINSGTRIPTQMCELPLDPCRHSDHSRWSSSHSVGATLHRGTTSHSINCQCDGKSVALGQGTNSYVGSPSAVNGHTRPATRQVNFDN